jgi:hypothetical protein
MKTQLYSDIFVNIFYVEGKVRDTQTCNIVWNMERDQSFWITSSEHPGTMPTGIFSFSAQWYFFYVVLSVHVYYVNCNAKT